ncbi:hypothetical protein BRADO4199 [Bradyrhizobium sp. ORS 278]|nr:hypothetical protein BRADO4199 [Bradyrhizobium sp. ORS 278]
MNHPRVGPAVEDDWPPQVRLVQRAATDSGPVMQNFKTEPRDMDQFPGDKTGSPGRPRARSPSCSS